MREKRFDIYILNLLLLHVASKLISSSLNALKSNISEYTFDFDSKFDTPQSFITT